MSTVTKYSYSIVLVENDCLRRREENIVLVSYLYMDVWTWTRLREMRMIEVQSALELVAEVPDGSPAREQLVELLTERRETVVCSLCLLRWLRALSGRPLPHWRRIRTGTLRMA